MQLIRLTRYTSWREIELGSALRVRRYAAAATPRLKVEHLESTVDRGTRFENSTLHYLSLQIPSMHLIRVGGANDGGVDLLGWWHLQAESTSTLSDRFRVVVQCKAESKKLGPVHVRELKGVVNTAKTDSTAVVAILASSSGFSKQCLLQGLACDFPLLFLHLVAAPSITSPKSEDDIPPTCLSMITNDALSNKLLQGKMEIKHIMSLDSKGQKQTIPTIYMNGKPL